MAAFAGSSVMEVLNRTDVGIPEFAAIAIGGLLAVVLLFFGIRRCVAFTKATDIHMHSLLKILLFSAGPLLASVFAIFHIEIPYTIPTVIAAVTGIVILGWNIAAAGIGYGSLFTVLHLLGGFFVGLGIGGLILMAVFGLALYFFGAFNITPGCESGGSSSDIYDVHTNEIFHVSAMNGNHQIYRGGWIPIRAGVYAGRYIDDYGNEYADCTD